jgi:transposase
MRPLGNPEVLQQRREHSIKLLLQGHAPVEVARIVGVDRRSVRRWHAAYRKKGRKGLAATHNTGRPPRLDATARNQLEQALLEGAHAAGFPNDLWTCPRVAHLIKSKFSISYHVDHIGRLLGSLGWSPQKPERRARERNEKAIKTWLKKQWPRIKKKPSA